MASTRDMLDRLEAQRAYFASDAHLVERGAVWRDMTPEQCLAATAEECATAERMLMQLEPAVRDRALASEPLPDDTMELLQQLWASRPRR